MYIHPIVIGTKTFIPKRARDELSGYSGFPNSHFFPYACVGWTGKTVF